MFLQKKEQRQRSTLLECASISHSTQHGDKVIVHIREKEEEEKKSNLRRGQSLLRLRFHLQVRYILFLSVSADGEKVWGVEKGELLML